jgi:SAM-dependent methyltransferase
MPPSNPNDAVREHYRTDEYLRVRQDTHDHYSVPRVDFAAWVLGFISWRGANRVLDLGCGTGNYYAPLIQRLPDVNYYGLDLSSGLLVKHAAQNRVLLGDAQQIPFADHTFDVVMANHMMYHVADVDATIKEIRRVLKPDGVFVAATNSIHSMPEFQVLFRRAIVLLSTPGSSTTSMPPPQPYSQFALENGSRYLARNFYAVVRYDLPGSFVFPSIEPVMAYLESTRLLREPLLPRGVLWDDVMTIMRQQIGHLLNHFGELVVNKVSGVLIASDQGGFIQEYTHHMQKAHPEAKFQR